MYGLNKVLQKRGDPQINCKKCNFPKIVQQKNTEPPSCAGAMFHVLVVSAVMPVHSEAPYGHYQLRLYDVEFCLHFGQFVRTVHKH